MAVTSIWRVNGWLGKVVVYVKNPEKTTNPEFYENGDMTERECQGLEDVISYAVSSHKTQQVNEELDTLERFVSGINCNPSTAREEMIAVKKRFGKEDGTIAYHGYQSFAPGEATPEMAHKIGVELAQRLWGDRYQVVVATHLDKANHLHSHFVLNTVSFFLLIYALSIGVALSSRRNYRRGEEHGSAKWGSATAVNKKYQAKNPEANKVFTKHVRMGLDGRKHRRNLNTVVVGGSGSGKSRFYALINLLQACSSYFVLDCKGELLRMTGTFLKMRGYEIKVLDLLSMEKSHCFNPFAYLETDNDVQKLVTSLFKATTPKGSQSNDPFWDTAASMLLSAIIFYLLYEAPEEEQNFPMVMEMLRAGEVREDDDSYQSPLDELFERLEMRNPDHIAVKYYKDYHSGSAKTLKSIQITLAARLEKFNLASVAALTATDELELASLGEKKVALFALIPDHDVSFNFLVSMVYSCTFEQLFRLADDKYKGALPVPVHFLMDEFANVSLPDDFDKLLATMRSRNVFVSIIIQNIAQLKNLFEKQWESILGNCDEFLYLGGNETGTHKMIAESYLGKQTIDMNTYGKSSGRSGNYSTNWQITGRELLDAAEVRMLDNRYALLFIRGEMPIMDEKYDLLNHPNVKFTPEKGGAPYVHGGTELSVGSLSLSTVSGTETKFINLSEIEFELLSDEEIEAELLSGGNKNEVL